MKDQYFGDKRDFFKWDFLEDVLGGCKDLRMLTYVAMLTPPDESKEGNLNKYHAGNRREPLFAFLQSCLAEGRQRVVEMRRYFAGCGIDYRPHGDEPQNANSYDTRERYFATIPDDSLRSALVFLDPDIGLNAGSLSYMRRSGISKYLFEESLVIVADRISDDSVVILYQHLQRDRSRFWDDVEERCERFRDAVRSQGAAFLTDRDIAFLAACRSPAGRLAMSTAIVAHAHRHHLDCGELAG